MADKEERQKIKSFTDLIAWQEAHKLILEVYRATDNFPNKEMFGLTNQMRRAAVSISSNIAEGFSRSSNADKVHFYTMSMGSLTELQNQLLISRDIGYLNKEIFESIANQSVRVSKLINGLKKINT